MSNSLGKKCHTLLSPQWEQSFRQLILRHFGLFSFFFLKKLHLVRPFPSFLAYQLINSTATRQDPICIKTHFPFIIFGEKTHERTLRVDKAYQATCVSTSHISNWKACIIQAHRVIILFLRAIFLWGFSRACSVTLEAGSLGETV